MLRIYCEGKCNERCKCGKERLTLAPALCVSVQIYLCCATPESTKYIIGWLSAPAQEITDGYLMICVDISSSLPTCALMWEREMTREGNYYWSKYLLSLIIRALN